MLALFSPRLASQMNTRVQYTRVERRRWKSCWINRRAEDPVSVKTYLSKDGRKRWKMSSFLSRIPLASVAFGFRWPKVTQKLNLSSFRWWTCFHPQLTASLMGNSKQGGMNTWSTLSLRICSTFFRCSLHTLKCRKQFNVWNMMAPWIHNTVACLWWFTKSKNLHVYLLFPISFNFLTLE